MRSPEFRAFSIALSMAVIAIAVKAHAKELPVVNHSSKRVAETESNNKFALFIEHVKSQGKDDEFGGGGAAKRLNFMQVSPVKFVELPEAHNPVSWTTRECGVVYGAADGKTPLALYIKRQAGRGEVTEEHWFRATLEGRLESATFGSALNDSNGKPIKIKTRDVSVAVADPGVEKVFAEELAYWTKDWLPKQLKKNGARKITAAGAKDGAGIALSPATR